MNDGIFDLAGYKVAFELDEAGQPQVAFMWPDGQDVALLLTLPGRRLLDVDPYRIDGLTTFTANGNTVALPAADMRLLLVMFGAAVHLLRDAYGWIAETAGREPVMLPLACCCLS